MDSAGKVVGIYSIASVVIKALNEGRMKAPSLTLHNLRCYKEASRLQKLDRDYANKGLVCYDREAYGFAVSPWLHN